LLLRSAEAIIDIAAPLDIYVHDHMIVDPAGHASLKGMKLNQSCSIRERDTCQPIA